MLVIGDREAAEGTVAVRTRAGGDQGARAVDAFIAAALDEVRARRAPAAGADASLAAAGQST
jgi:threonyl-tRNA synthetase